jgi:hypothetical protein
MKILRVYCSPSSLPKGNLPKRSILLGEKAIAEEAARRLVNNPGVINLDLKGESGDKTRMINNIAIVLKTKYADIVGGEKLNNVTFVFL